ncbi:MAG: type II toxin-antitoxin system HicB family antitoxin [Crocosphaera sp.]|nr:type II toxin-antitoxin system HicB family antitoxin [Crocosphaera sp.]
MKKLHKNLEMKQQFNVIIEKDSDGYLVASVPALKGCHTQAKSYDELIERIKEAIELCLEMENQDFETLEFVAVERITINS